MTDMGRGLGGIISPEAETLTARFSTARQGHPTLSAEVGKHLFMVALQYRRQHFSEVGGDTHLPVCGDHAGLVDQILGETNSLRRRLFLSRHVVQGKAHNPSLAMCCESRLTDSSK